MVFAVIGLCGGYASAQLAPTPATSLYLTDADITFIREQIAAGRAPWADEFDLLGKRLKSLREKSVPKASVDPPKQPLRMLRSAGMLHPREPGRMGKDAKKLLADGHMARDLALHYRLAGDEASGDAEAAVKILLAWPKAVSARAADRWVAMDVAIALPAMLYAADLLRGFPGFDKTHREPFEKWAIGLVEGAVEQYRIHGGYPGKAHGLYQATWTRHLALAAGTVFAKPALRSWAIGSDSKKPPPIPRMLKGAFNALGRPIRTVGLGETVFALEPLLLMAVILGHEGAEARLDSLGLNADGRAWMALDRVGQFLCNDNHLPATAAEMPRDRKGRALLPIVFGEATVFVPLTTLAAAGEHERKIRTLAQRVRRHNPRARRTADGTLDARARIEPWVLGPVFLTHYRPPAPPGSPTPPAP